MHRRSNPCSLDDAHFAEPCGLWLTDGATISMALLVLPQSAIHGRLLGLADKLPLDVLVMEHMSALHMRRLQRFLWA